MTDGAELFFHPGGSFRLRFRLFEFFRFRVLTFPFLLTIIYPLHLMQPNCICGSAGIGRQARLRGVCCMTYGFKSHLPHQSTFSVITEKVDFFLYATKENWYVFLLIWYANFLILGKRNSHALPRPGLLAGLLLLVCGDAGALRACPGLAGPPGGITKKRAHLSRTCLFLLFPCRQLVAKSKTASHAFISALLLSYACPYLFSPPQPHRNAPARHPAQI